MEIVENKAVRFRTRNPGQYAVIPKHHVQPIPGGHEVTVHWGLDEMRVLKNMGVKDVPSPIQRKYKWPGRYTPMSHQKVTAGFTTLHRRGFIFNEPGTAKTISVLWAMDYLMTVGEVRRCLIVCPLSIMHSAWMGDIANSVIHRTAVVAHHAQASRRIELIQGDYEIVIINYDGLNLVADEINANGKFDMVVVDECFVAGSRVRTPQGVQAIETLQAGDDVLTSSGVKRINQLVRNTAERLVTVETNDGKKITCTPEHPFFTDAGWVTANNTVGRRLLRTTEVPDVSAGVHTSDERGGAFTRAGYAAGDDMLAILRAEEVPRVESGEVVFHQHAKTTARGPDGHGALGNVQGQHVTVTESKSAQAETEGRQRHGHDVHGTAGVPLSVSGVGLELPRSVGREAARLSHELQTRLCMRSAESRTGGGRELAQHDGTESTGSQKGNEAAGTWVVRVSYHESTSPTTVYNLDVEGTPNYFVEDVLVHNCNCYGLPTTRRWKSLAKIIRPDTFLWMMTGTPAAQSPLTAYGLAKLVNPTAVPNYMTAWRDKVMTKISTFKWIPKHDAKEQVFRVLQPAIRFTKAQCLDLPPVLKTTRIAPMTPQQQKYYKLLKDNMLASTAGSTITAVNKAALVNKLLQISAGAVYSETHETVEFDATPRMNLLLEILNETERKVIIFALFRSSIDIIYQFLVGKGHTVGIIHGDVSATKRGDLINRFQHTAEPRVLVMQPQATAHGITLTAADTVVFFGPLMSVEQYTQCIARADRKGQSSDKVTVVHIQSSPIEEKMFKAMDARVNDHALLTQMFDEEMEET